MRKGLGFHDRHSPFRFDPATLFIGGAIEGAFYDPSNITTLFQDDAGTTPVTAVEQTVGRILDLSGNANHAAQSVLASRPTYRARYNSLTYTEEFNNAAWARTNCNVLANTDLAPNGTLTADRLITNAAVSNGNIIHTASLIQGVVYTFSCYAKSAGATNVRLRGTGSGSWISAIVNLTTGVVSSTLLIGTATVAAAENGFWRITITGTCDFTGNNSIWLYDWNAGNGTDGVVIWGAQLLPANDVAITGNAYQRVAAATSYDTSSPVWRPYLALDGSNDSMLTGSIDFTGTDKMTVWAGVTKSSDAALGMLAELSNNANGNFGAFWLAAPLSAGAANYDFRSAGTSPVSANYTNAAVAAPTTNVLAGLANIGAPSAILRVNGAQVASNTTSQGTGNYGNHPLYIGRRNNATLPFNGRLYGLIVLGAAASDWQVYVTEQWMAGKTGLQF